MPSSRAIRAYPRPAPRAAFSRASGDHSVDWGHVADGHAIGLGAEQAALYALSPRTSDNGLDGRSCRAAGSAGGCFTANWRPALTHACHRIAHGWRSQVRVCPPAGRPQAGDLRDLVPDPVSCPGVGPAPPLGRGDGRSGEDWLLYLMFADSAAGLSCLAARQRPRTRNGRKHPDGDQYSVVAGRAGLVCGQCPVVAHFGAIAT
jgi:hypothetical protein